MDDMNAFERQVAGRIQHHAGPVRPVNDAAIFSAITTTQSPKWRFQSMFSATKFVVAGAILALFGGFLLSGVLTQQPSDDPLPVVGASASAMTQAEATAVATSEPERTAEAEADDTATPVILPGVDLVTEEVEPGVYRVLSDGVRDPSRAIEQDPQTSDDASARSAYVNELHRGAIETDADGGVWLLWPDRFFRLGADTTGAWPEPTPTEGRYDMALHTELDPAGILYRGGPNLAGFGQASDGAGWLSFDGESWHQVPSPGDGLAITDFRVAPDSTVWAMTTPTDRGPESFRTGKRLARLDGDGWTRISLPPAPGKEPRAIQRWGVTHDGAVWLTRARRDVYLFEEGAWQPLGRPAKVPGAVVGPYGDVLHDGSGLQVDARGRTPEAAVPDQLRWPTKTEVEIAPDRSLWYPAAAAGEDGMNMPNAGCDGLVRWQAGTVARYLRGTCIYDLAIAPDGAVWLQAGTWIGSRRFPELVGPIHTYVITPEAVAE